MIKVNNIKNLKLMYGLQRKVFVNRNTRLQDDYLTTIRAIIKSENDIKNGRIIPAEKVFGELRKMYGY